MGGFPATTSGILTRRTSVRDRHGPARLRDNALGSDLFRGDSPIDRNDIPRSLDARGHQQTLLARLVATFSPTDADKIANELLSTFGSLGQVLSASGSAVRRVTGNGELADVILLAKSIVLESMREDLRQGAFLFNDPKFNQFVIATLGNARQEKMLAIFLDARTRYIQDDIVAHGGWSEVQLHLRSLLRRAIELDCARIVLCHNHPSGRAEPSKRDIEFTDRLAKCAASLGIEIVDHLIVAGPRVCSMRAVGVMR